MIKKLLVFLVICLCFCSVSFASEIDDVKKAVKIYKEIQDYVDSSTFVYGFNQKNQQHIDYIVYAILWKYGIKEKETYFVAAIGDANGKPIYVRAFFEINGVLYDQFFKITNIEKIKENCEDGTSECA